MVAGPPGQVGQEDISLDRLLEMQELAHAGVVRQGVEEDLVSLSNFRIALRVSAQELANQRPQRESLRRDHVDHVELGGGGLAQRPRRELQLPGDQRAQRLRQAGPHHARGPAFAGQAGQTGFPEDGFVEDQRLGHHGSSPANGRASTRGVSRDGHFTQRKSPPDAGQSRTYRI
jgi:hypothetical protein